MYDSTVGRFLSEDPIGFAGGDPNVFRYVRNAPADHEDPSGLMASEIITWHHLFPKAEEFLNFLAEKGIDKSFVDSPQNGWYLVGGDHTDLHSNSELLKNWNAEWERWMKSQKNEKTKLSDILEKIEDMKKEYGLVDPNNSKRILKGSPVNDVDGMPYDHWSDKSKRQKWWKDKGKSIWKPSSEEFARNKSRVCKSQRPGAADAPDLPDSPPAKGGHSTASGGKPGRSVVVHSIGYIQTLIDGIFLYQEIRDTQRRAEENGRTFDQQIKVDVESSSWIGTPFIPTMNPFQRGVSDDGTPVPFVGT